VSNFTYLFELLANASQHSQILALVPHPITTVKLESSEIYFLLL